ncbi:MAG: hypothetical protein JKY59_01920 [Emcibacter sp.]|nr:hypothetical protein [Emcibacter sp.]
MTRKGHRTAWLSLDEEDNAPAVLVGYLVFALWQAGLDRHIKALLTEEFDLRADIRETLTILAAAIEQSEMPLLLILDNFENLGDKCIKAVIEPILKYFPENFHLAIASRKKSGVALSELRLRGLVNEFNATDMKFTSFEVSGFLESFLNKNQIQQVIERSEGWPVALQYLRIAMTHNSDHDLVLENFKGIGQEINDYFSEQFLSRLDKDQKNFLLETSILDYITQEVADYIRDATDSEIQLKNIQDMAGFIMPVKDREGTYRLHSLLREFLQNHLRVHDSEKYRILHQRAAVWISRKGYMTRAIKYALEIGDQETAADIVEKEGGVLLWNQEGMARLRAVHDLLPDDIVIRRPRLLLVRALILLKDGKLNDVREILHDVRSIKSTKPDYYLKYDIAVIASTLAVYDGTDPTEAIRELGTLLDALGSGDGSQRSFVCTANCVVSFQSGRFEEARNFAHQGQAILRESKMPFGETYFNIHIGTTYYAEGKLSDAFAHYEKAQNSMRRYFMDDKDLRLVSNIQMAEWHFERNEIATAQRLLGDVNQRLVNGEAWYEIYAAGYSTASAIAFEGEGLDACRRLVDEAVQYIQREGLKRLRRLVMANLAGYMTRSGQVEQARKIIQENGLSLKEYKKPDIENPLVRERYGVVLALCRLLIAEKRYDEAIGELGFFIDLEKGINHHRARLKYSLLLSIALFLAGQKRKSFEILTEVLTQVRKEGFIRLVLDEAPFINDLFGAYMKSILAAEKDHAAYLLNFLKKDMKKPEITRLSKRGYQVLDQLSEGHSDKVIARNLEITENTVRFHLKNIYSKLGVNSRLRAVKEGRKLDFLHQSNPL